MQDSQIRIENHSGSPPVGSRTYRLLDNTAKHRPNTGTVPETTIAMLYQIRVVGTI